MQFSSQGQYLLNTLSKFLQITLFDAVFMTYTTLHNCIFELAIGQPAQTHLMSCLCALLSYSIFDISDNSTFLQAL